jgi:LCP family protein required for cell wall assembly
MRTTLKRGVGRSASFNGDGPAVLPPGALSAVVRYTQPPPPRRSRWRLVGQAFFWLGALVVMVATATAAGTWLYGEDTVSLIQARHIEVKKAADRLDTPLPGKPAIALLLGYDHRKSDGANAPSRSDTVMLVRVDPEKEAISLLSFPRDLQVPIICPGHTYLPDRINAAYSLGGPKCTVETVKSLTGLPINYLVTVNFRGFTQVVDKLGGVWLDVDRRYFHENAGGYDQYAAINLQPGYQKVNGGQALSFVRYRHTDNDLIRNARQQLFLRAIKDRISHDLHADTIPKVVGALRRNIEVGVGGGEKLTLKTVISYALLAYQMPSGNVFRVKIDNVTGAGIPGNPLVAPAESIREAVDEFVNPDVDAPEKAAARALGQKARLKRGLPPREISVVALNGNNVPGAAANASAQLAEREYHTLLPPNGLVANAPRTFFRTQIYYNPGYKRAKQAAEQVANLFGSADVTALPTGRKPVSRQLRRLSHGAMLVAVVGTTYRGNLAPAPKDRTPVRKPPAVVKNPDASIGYMREARKYVPFRLYVPTVIERNSVIDSTGYDAKPVRVYRISGKHKAVRLTFHTYGNAYWGIEETNWEDAPVFDSSNTKRKIKGREYELYFSGSHLHMVVLRDGPRSYWVVNSLNDELSNETMLAIARGLKPMKRR